MKRLVSADVEEQYVKCPHCKQEWTKLHKCKYKNDDGDMVTTYLCVNCAEGIKMLKTLALAPENKGLGIKVVLCRIPMCREMGDEFNHLRQVWQAVIRMPNNETIIATTQSTSYPIVFWRREGKKMRKFTAQNILEGWQYLKKGFQESAPEEMPEDEDTGELALKTQP